MGCFNTSCGVSRVSIRGSMPAVIIPLLSVEQSNECRSDGAMFISNDGPKHTYYPFALPIMGEYTDYGTLEDIEENVHTKALEKYFEMDIQKIADFVCRPWDGDGGSEKFPKNPYGMWVHRRVYDHLASDPMNEYGERDSAYHSAYIKEYVLQLMGFENKGIDESQKRYNIRYEHPKIPNLIVWSDGTWNRFIIDGKEHTCYNPKQLEELLVKNNMFVPPQLTELKTVHHYGLLYDESLENYSVFTEAERRMYEEFQAAVKSESNKESVAEVFKKYDTKIVAELLIKSTRQRGETILSFGDRYGTRQNFFDEFYSGCVKDETFKKMFVEFKNFEHGLYMVNADYRPVWCGLQCGNYRASKAMGEVIVEIAEGELEDERKYLEEDDL